MLKQTPFHALETTAGAVFVESGGWRLPAHFGDGSAEYEQVREQCAFFDFSHHGRLHVAGRDAASFLHNLCTNDVLRLPENSACEAFLTTGQAKIVAHVLIERLTSSDGSSAYALETPPGLAEKVLKHLDRHLISERVELADRSDETAQLHLAGPRAPEVLQKIAGEVTSLQPLQHVDRTLSDGSACRNRRHDPLGVPGFDMVVASHEAARLWEVLRSVGAHPAGEDPYHTLRLEAGMPLYGVDIDETNLPQEVGRDEQTISFTKGCYIGQETVARIRTYGHVNRQFVGLKIPHEGVVPHRATVFREGKEIGHVTSSAYSPRLGTTIALGYVRRGSHLPGTAVEIEADGQRLTAEVVVLPFTT